MPTCRPGTIALACLALLALLVVFDEQPARHGPRDAPPRRLQQEGGRGRWATGRGAKGLFRRQRRAAQEAAVAEPPAQALLTTPADVAWRLEHCAPLPQWPASRFSHDQDWVPIADGSQVAPDTLWRWEGGGRGRLLNQGSGGYLNYRGDGLVRGHGDSPPFVAAPATAKGTLFTREAVDAEPYRQDAPPCSRPPATYALRFVGGGTYLEVEASDGTANARVSECSDLALCLWDLEPQPPPNSGWLGLRSRLTGRLLRMVGKDHVPFGGWDGVAHKATPKTDARLAAERTAAASALSASARCPLKLTPAISSAAPAGWSFNGSAYAPAIRRALEPWNAGGLSATALDMVFWHELYPPQNKAEQPSLHVSYSRANGLRYVYQHRDGLPGGAPPPNSTDAAFLAMLLQVSHLVELPDIEAVAHTASLPKIPKQNPEPVLSPVANAAHADIPAPSVWAWAEAGAGAARGRCPAARTRTPRLLLSAECEGPTDGFRGPLWRWYAPHLAAALAARHPRLMHVVLRRACTGPVLPGGGMPVLEHKWDRLAEASLEAALTEAAAAAEARHAARRRGGAAALRGVTAEAVADPCEYRWVLLLDGTGPPRDLLARLRQGFTVFKQASPHREFFTPALRPWVHYVPVAENLSDLPARVRWAAANPEAAAAIARRGRALATSMHELEIACYWWQLLTAYAPLQSYAPRGGQFGRRVMQRTR